MENIIDTDNEKVNNDEALYRSSVKGDQAAAEKLVERYGDALTFYVNGYIHDIHDAEDIMIDAFAQMFVKMRPVGRAGSFRAYIYKTARNLAVRHKKGQRIFINIDDVGFELEGEDKADVRIVKSERDRQLYGAIERLKAEYQEVLYLIYFEDMSYREAGAVMGKSESQITKLVYRGRQRLKAILEKEGFVYENY